MTALPVTSFYAAPLALLLVWLSIRVIQNRVRARVAIGLGEDEALLRASRAQANFIEYVPMALILLALLEASGASALLLHALGAGLLAGRLAHGIGIAQMPENLRLRQIGMALTFGVLGAGAALLLLRTVVA
jgi:uncharacterized membrane protein YecN with MAPEG domain